VEQVVQLLLNYTQTSAATTRNPQLIDCITSWLREIPLSAVIKSPLLDIIFDGLGDDSTIQEASECLCAIFSETREIDENLGHIEVLYPRVVALVPQLRKAAEDEDTEAFGALTKVISKAAYCWVVAVVRHPAQFRSLVEAVLECAARDKDRDAIEHTFRFWYDLRMYLTIEKYEDARLAFLDIFPKLVDVFLERLQFPTPESGNEQDLFEGDREQEERFREFRHQIGDTLKDAATVMGPSACLGKIFESVKIWTQKYAALASGTSVPHWQELEAALFSLRAVGREIPSDESEVLPQLIPLLVQIPSHPKLRFAATMVISRYTEWTANHPEFLQPQFNYIISSFESDTSDVLRAAAMALRFFCHDCPRLLSDQVQQLRTFYNTVLDKLPDLSQEEMTEGMAAVVNVQPIDQIYGLLKQCCDPLVLGLMNMANTASDEPAKRAMADRISLLSVFVQVVQPYVETGEENPAVTYWKEVFPVLSTILDNFITSSPIVERICSCWRSMLLSYRTAMTPLLAPLANKLASGFQQTRNGCFLWVTGTVVREFSDHRENVDAAITDSIYEFFEAQAVAFLRTLSETAPRDFADAIEDFFRLVTDALLYYPHRLIPSTLLKPIFEATSYVLVLEQRNPLTAALDFMRDLLTWGSNNPASSNKLPAELLAQFRTIILQLVSTHGEALMKQIITGLVFRFHGDCYSSATGVIVEMLQIMPDRTMVWLKGSLELLDTLSPTEMTQLLTKVHEQLGQGGPQAMRQIRGAVDTFAYNYRRRHVAPRDGLDQVETASFRYTG
jgi:transportin-3